VAISKPKLLIENLTLIIAASADPARLSILPKTFLSRTTTEVNHEKRDYGLMADRGGNRFFMCGFRGTFLGLIVNVDDGLWR
jgi:hypothetical protein